MSNDELSLNSFILWEDKDNFIIIQNNTTKKDIKI